MWGQGTLLLLGGFALPIWAVWQCRFKRPRAQREIFADDHGVAESRGRRTLCVVQLAPAIVATTMADFSDILYPCLGFAVLCSVTTVTGYYLPVFSKLEWQKRLFCALCCASLTNCCTVTWPALQGFYELYKGGFTFGCGDASLLRLTAPSSCVLACGLVCGYFVQDSAIMMLFPKETTKELGGSTSYKIMWMHHIVSLFVWPYAMMQSKCVVFVAYFMATEVTNIGQNLFLLANRADLFGKGVDLYIGLVWAFTFLVARVLPVPFIMYAWFYTHLYPHTGGCGGDLSTVEYFVSLITVPIPVALNLFWFYKIVSKARRMMGKSKDKGK